MEDTGSRGKVRAGDTSELVVVLVQAEFLAECIEAVWSLPGYGVAPGCLEAHRAKKANRRAPKVAKP